MATREPLDIDLHLPTIVDRDDAMARLDGLVTDAQPADALWADIIGPLYDRLAYRDAWPDGRCPCGAWHPQRWANKEKLLRGSGARPWPGHRMACPRYVGPLQHGSRGGSYSPIHPDRVECICGQSYDSPPGGSVECPDAAIDWRGPRTAAELAN